MPKHHNPKIEAFCQNLAKGMKQGRAYSMAGYSPNKAGASRMAKTPEIVDRVAEIKEDLTRKVEAVALLDDADEITETLAEMGITMSWIAAQYKAVYQASLTAGAHSAANQSLANIQKMLEVELATSPDAERLDQDMISVDGMLRLLHGVHEAGIRKEGDPAPQTDTDSADFTLVLPDLDAMTDDDEDLS